MATGLFASIESNDMNEALQYYQKNSILKGWEDVRQQNSSEEIYHIDSVIKKVRHATEHEKSRQNYGNYRLAEKEHQLEMAIMQHKAYEETMQIINAVQH